MAEVEFVYTGNVAAFCSKLLKLAGNIEIAPEVIYEGPAHKVADIIVRLHTQPKSARDCIIARMVSVAMGCENAGKDMYFEGPSGLFEILERDMANRIAEKNFVFDEKELVEMKKIALQAGESLQERRPVSSEAILAQKNIERTQR